MIFFLMTFLNDKLLVIFFLVSSFMVCSAVMGQPGAIKDYPFLNSINEINKDTPDTCRIAAFVNSVFHCPACPPGAICKPCIGNHIMISDTLNAKKQFRVFVYEPDKFWIGEKCTVLVRLYKYNLEQEVYEGKLISKQ